MKSYAESTRSKKSRAPFFQKKDAGASFFARTGVQPKLTIGQPGDRYEREADRMAEQVVSRSASAPVQAKCAACEAEDKGAVLTKILRQEEEEEMPMQGKLQRQEEEEEMPIAGKLQRQEEEEEMQMQVQRKTDTPEGFVDEKEMLLNQPTQLQSNGGTPEVGGDLEGQLSSSRGGGSPLAPSVQREMGSAFGTDFSGVRVHTDASAVQMSRDLHAQAFTHGSDVYFNSGKYDPGSSQGKRLLAHELTHVVQQGGGG